MTKKLTNMLGAGILAGAGILGLVGCETLVSTYRFEKPRKFPEGHIHGVEYPTMDQSRVPYKLEEQVLYGVGYYLQERKDTPETLPFAFLPFNKVIRVIDLDSNKIALDSEEKYVPRKVKIEGGATQEGYVDQINIRATDSKKTGVKGIKANIISLEELREMADISEDGYGFKVITTEDGASFAIKTKQILGEGYFFPHVSEKETDEKGKLPFYLIPIKGAKIKMQNSCGNLSIFNKNSVYRPELVKEDEIVKGRLGPGQTTDKKRDTE